MFNILLLLNLRLFLLCVNRCVESFTEGAVTSDAWNFVLGGIKMGLLVGEQWGWWRGGDAAGAGAKLLWGIKKYYLPEKTAQTSEDQRHNSCEGEHLLLTGTSWNWAVGFSALFWQMLFSKKAWLLRAMANDRSFRWWPTYLMWLDLIASCCAAIVILSDDQLLFRDL